MNLRALVTAIVLAMAVSNVGVARAQATGVVTISYVGSAQPYLGNEHRETINKIVADRPTPQQGLARLQPVLAWCDGKASSETVTYVSVDNDAAAADFRAQHPSAKNVVLIDAACPGAYKLSAYFQVEAGDMQQALLFLDKATAIAPYYPDAWSERGFILNQQHQPAAAADAYRHALALVARNPDPASQAMALRGLGYSLVELGDLAGARAAYQQSLVLDPKSETAPKELEYIDALEHPPGEAPAATPGAAVKN